MKSFSFTGTRKGMSESQEITLIELIRVNKFDTIFHGDAVGADEQAHKIAVKYGLKVFKRPCKLTSQRAHTTEGIILEGPVEPLERNKMLVMDSEILIATPADFIEEQRSGTWSTVRFARKQDKHIFIIWPDGIVS
jgi:predicted Rossmann fold nucleotide-binding protein DprA/Smf involved in DNA uptake